MLKKKINWIILNLTASRTIIYVKQQGKLNFNATKQKLQLIPKKPLIIYCNSVIEFTQLFSNQLNVKGYKIRPAIEQQPGIM